MHATCGYEDDYVPDFGIGGVFDSMEKAIECIKTECGEVCCDVRHTDSWWSCMYQTDEDLTYFDVFEREVN